jgi:hypothetical protein
MDHPYGVKIAGLSYSSAIGTVYFVAIGTSNNVVSIGISL